MANRKETSIMDALEKEDKQSKAVRDRTEDVCICNNLKSVIQKLQSLSDKLAAESLCDSYDQFSKYISSLLRGIPKKEALNLKKKLINDVFEALSAHERNSPDQTSIISVPITNTPPLLHVDNSDGRISQETTTINSLPDVSPLPLYTVNISPGNTVDEPLVNMPISSRETLMDVGVPGTQLPSVSSGHSVKAHKRKRVSDDESASNRTSLDENETLIEFQEGKELEDMKIDQEMLDTINLVKQEVLDPLENDNTEQMAQIFLCDVCSTQWPNRDEFIQHFQKEHPDFAPNILQDISRQESDDEVIVGNSGNWPESSCDESDSEVEEIIPDTNTDFSNKISSIKINQNISRNPQNVPRQGCHETGGTLINPSTLEARSEFHLTYSETDNHYDPSVPYNDSDFEYKQCFGSTDSSCDQDHEYSNKFTGTNSIEEGLQEFVPSNSDSVVSHKQEVTSLFSHNQESIILSKPLKKDSRRVFDKKQACLYCLKLFSKLPQHIETAHTEKKEVTDIMNLPKNSKERATKIRQLRNKGNYIHNMKVLKNKGGSLIVFRRSLKDSYTQDDYLPCEFCYAFFYRKVLWRHMKQCPDKNEKTLLQGKKCSVRNAHLRLLADIEATEPLKDKT